MSAQFVPGQPPSAGPPFPYSAPLLDDGIASDPFGNRDSFAPPDPNVVQKMQALNLAAPPQQNGQFYNGPDASSGHPPKPFSGSQLPPIRPFGQNPQPSGTAMTNQPPRPNLPPAGNAGPPPAFNAQGLPPVSNSQEVFRGPTPTTMPGPPPIMSAQQQKPTPGGFQSGPPFPGRPPSVGQTPPVSQNPFGAPPISQSVQSQSGPFNQQPLPPFGQSGLPNAPGMLPQQMPPMSGQQTSISPGRQMPPTQGQQMPSPPGQQIPSPGQHMPSPPGQQMPPVSVQQMPPVSGQQIPSALGRQQMPPTLGHQMPPPLGQQLPPPLGQQMQPSAGAQMLPPSGPQMPPPSGPQIPPLPGSQMQLPPGQQLPSFSQQPQLPGQRMPTHPLPGQQIPPLPGQQIPTGPTMGSAPYPGAPPAQSYQNQHLNKTPGSPPMPGYPGQPQTGYPSQQPGVYPGQQNSYPGQQMGYPGQQQGYPGQQNQYGYQPQTAKKLNPDQMPSPIQVMVDDQNNFGGMFATNGKGRVPPLVTTDFTVIDQGNASPRYIRSSMYNVPATPDMMKQTAVPFCVVLSPMAEVMAEERPPPLLDFSVLTGVAGMGPVRCCRCKAYMCPAMKFVDAGRHFQCAFCKATTEVPMEYTQYLNNGQHYGQSTPEMSLGCYEIVATKEYCRNNVLPTPPALIFVVDVSYNAVRSGLVQLVVGQLRSLLSNLPIPPRVGLITYSSTIHFYNINKNLGQPQMMVVGDIQDVFVPLSHGLLAEPGQADHLLDALAQQIPQMFLETKETETILLPAVKAGLEALKAADCCGKLLIFHSSLPSAPAPGQLVNRDDRKLLGTDKEKNILNPQTKAYNEVAQECVNAGCGIDMFLFNNAYVDVATLGQLSRLTGGSLHKYTYFQAEIDGERFIEDLTRVLSRPTAYDAVMRVRTSTGVRATDFYGHFFMSNTTDVELATLDCDKAIAVEIKHDDKLTGEDGVYIQVALLYTHASGQRRLRICNLALGIATQMADLYRTCDLDTIINFLTKQAISKLSEHTPKSIKESIIARCAQSLACYRKHCATPSSVGQLVLPESMKLFPIYVNCILRSDAVSGGPDMSCDDRSWAMQAALYADVSTSVVMLYPRLLCLNPLASGNPAEPLRCTIEKLRDDSIFLLENSIHMMLWIGLQTPSELIRGLFGVNSAAEINTEETHLPELTSEFNERIRELIRSIRKERRRAMRLTIVRQHDKLEMVFRHFLVEDDGRNGATSYMDFLCHVHKEIRALL